MTAYLVAEVSDISDPQTIAEYREDAQPLIKKYGGRFLARGEPCTPLEGQWGRVVIVAFPDMKTAESFFYSPEYTALKEKREHAATFRIIIVNEAV